MRSLFALLAVVLVVALILLRSNSDGRIGGPDVVRESGASTDGDEGAHLGTVASSAASGARVEAELDTVGSLHGPSKVGPDWGRRLGILAVRVIGSEGVVEGATVHVASNVFIGFLGEPDVDGIAHADADGMARFYVQPGRTAMVSAAASGSVWASMDAFTTPFAGDERSVTLKLAVWESGVERSIVVRSIPGLAPIEGACVVIRTGAYAGILGETSFTTDGAGQVTVPWRAGVAYDVTAAKHAASTLAGSAVEASDAGAVHIDLKRHARLHGTLPIEHAGGRSRRQVELRGPRLNLASQIDAAFELARITGQFGATLARVDVDPDGTWVIDDVEFPPRVDTLKGLTVVMTVDNMSRSLIGRLTLRPGDDVQVMDEHSGAPDWTVTVQYVSGEPLGPGSWIQLMEPGGDVAEGAGVFAKAKLNRAGRARFDHVPLGPWDYSISCNGAESGRIVSQLVNNGSGESGIVLDGLGVVHGRVETADGEPVRGAFVSLRRADESDPERQVGTGQDGLFRFGLVPTDVDLILGLAEPQGAWTFTQAGKRSTVAGFNAGPQQEESVRAGKTLMILRLP